MPEVRVINIVDFYVREDHTHIIEPVVPSYTNNPGEADKVRYFKEDEKGVAAMCKVMEDMRNEEAKKTKVIDIENLMKNLKLTVEQAMDALSIPQSQRSTYAGLVGKRMQ